MNFTIWRSTEIAEFCRHCKHLHRQTPTEQDPWAYGCDVPTMTLTIARERNKCEYLEAAK